MSQAVVIMGVAGCGKSSLGAALTKALGTRLIEGDDYHSPFSRAKMAQGIPLTDADREGWLDTLGQLLGNSAADTILTCSALKRAYRDKLRAHAPQVQFVFLDIAPPEALRRVTARAAEHFFPGNLVASQFATLEPPSGEAGVLTLDANLPVAELVERTVAWLQAEKLEAQP